MNKIVNVINFIRASEPRDRSLDLHLPVVEQMRLAREHKLPTTWLLQYDALIDGWYVDFLKRNMPPEHEIGVWFEIMQPLVEKAGIPWRGRWDWDWHTHVGFSVGYSPAEREKICDVFMAEFKSQFGAYPKSMGSWLFDAHLLNYMYEKYGLESACNCKDQWGTDGYTLWGGYWANGYYACRRNSYLPARDPADQIPVPIFRMLGSDPIYQYDADPGADDAQPVITMEPVYTGYQKLPAGGGVPAWVDWFLQENFTDPVMAMGYVQIGQENSFGWPAMKTGLEYQYAKVAELARAGALAVMTLGGTGRWFRRNFPVTPVSSVVALDDWQHQNRSSIWALSRYGRFNLVRDADRSLAIRDWQIFSDEYAEPFLDAVCPVKDCTYDALPVLDGMRWSGTEPARMRFTADGKPLRGGFSGAESPDKETLTALWTCDSGERITLACCGAHLTVKSAHPGLVVEFVYDPAALARAGTEILLADLRTLSYIHTNGPESAAYVLKLDNARFEAVADGFRILPEGGEFVLSAHLSE